MRARLLLLGASGYVGDAFRRTLRQREIDFVAPGRRELEATNFAGLTAFLRRERPSFVINCAGFTGRPNVDACESARAETLVGNAILPLTLAHACDVTKTPWAHISSGCIYSGAKLVTSRGVKVEKNLRGEPARALIQAGAKVAGYVETDPPNFTFRDPPSSFYSGSKALAEESLADFESLYVFRLRIPFDHEDHPRNYLTKLMTYEKVYDATNSLSHREHFVAACLDLWQAGAPFGVYNLTNPGFVDARRVVEMIQQHLAPERPFAYWESDAEFYEKGVIAPRSNAVLDCSKAIAHGAKLPPVEEALESALSAWRRRA